MLDTEQLLRQADGLIEFFDAIITNFEKGGDQPDRFWGNWRFIEWSAAYESLYTAKLIGHMAQAMRATGPDRREHLAAVASNAAILWKHTKEKSYGHTRNPGI